MRRLTAVLAMMFVLGLTQTNIEGQKNKPTVVPVTATFDAEVILNEDEPAVLAGILSVPGAVAYPGTVNLDGGFNLVSGNSLVDFAPGVFAFADPPNLAPSIHGTNFSMGTHNVGKVLPGEDLAGQAGLTWTDAASGKSYRLQYGDVYDLDNVDYAHITCSEAVGTGCNEWVLSTKRTDETHTGDVTVRRTGPKARLTVRAGPGAKGVVDLGYLEVPFSLRIRRNP